MSAPAAATPLHSAEAIDLSVISATLDAAIAAAAPTRLVDAHTQAANALESLGSYDAACFQLVHAYAHALEAGDASLTEPIRARLVAAGREA